MAQDIDTVATWLAQFQTRRQLRSYLLEPKERSRFIVPSPALALYIAAVLAVLDRDPAVVALADEHELDSRWNDGINAERKRRLRDAIAAMDETGADA